ncbi:sugar ABC transporter ATP-binding protein [Variovorax sp. YR216]|uniref:sugar ABC transporter ATP-binding protein n=1 Tax=Variovorax sp. YR216 TaxID=1882828 RepID=UPI00089D0A53|nr:sugar ABC transporter ATP-binding protein [Variovorax sp. YR216]SEB22165.1 monosaccharide ABC transporter ATP-binding protein, CUT2 family [Variovorax sp. YR216]
MPEGTPHLLELRNISKTFPGVKALQNVQLHANKGLVHALMGENGAGKSTLMKILSGAYMPDAGAEIRIDGKQVNIDGPLAAKALGVSVIYQELSLAPNLTVAENIYMGRPMVKGALVDRAGMAESCTATLKRLGADFGPTTIVESLSIAQRQLVEIARAVHFDCRILVMDEPTTPLSTHETDRLFALIKRLRSEGMAILYISHRMDEIDELADEVTVLRDGTYVGTLERAELSRDKLVKMMVGRDLSGFYRKEHQGQHTGARTLAVRNMADGRRVRGCSLELFAGEVLGLAGLVGAGRTELARLIFGADARTSGDVQMGDNTLKIEQPLDAIRAGILYLTEDRKGEGLFLDLSVRDNINVMVCPLDARGGGVMDGRRAFERARDAIKQLSIRVASPRVNVGSLSGGNQQKVLLARLLELKPKVLILDEPTRGVDIGAKSEIYRLIDELARSGVAVLVISSELAEVVGVCDRVIVMREGQLVGEVGGDTGTAITQENIVALATGATTGTVPTVH